MTSTAIHTTAFAALLAIACALTAMAQDTGELDKAVAERVHPSKPPYSPYAGRNFPTCPFFGDTHLRTHSPWMRECSARASARTTPIASPGARRSRLPVVSASSWPGRRTSSSWRITRTASASSRCFSWDVYPEEQQRRVDYRVNPEEDASQQAPRDGGPPPYRDGSFARPQSWHGLWTFSRE